VSSFSHALPQQQQYVAPPAEFALRKKNGTKKERNGKEKEKAGEKSASLVVQAIEEGWEKISSVHSVSLSLSLSLSRFLIPSLFAR
jgi:hypothetical protein